LTPDDFGVVGYAITAITFLDVVSDLGVGPALIYHTEDEKTSSTAFWLGLLFGFVMLLYRLGSSALCRHLFRDVRVVSVTRALSFIFPLNALGSTHESVMYKNWLLDVW